MDRPSFNNNNNTVMTTIFTLFAGRPPVATRFFFSHRTRAVRRVLLRARAVVLSSSRSLFVRAAARHTCELHLIDDEKMKKTTATENRELFVNIREYAVYGNILCDNAKRYKRLTHRVLEILVSAWNIIRITPRSFSSLITANG